MRLLLFGTLLGGALLAGVGSENQGRDRDTSRVRSQDTERTSQREAKASFKQAPEKLTKSDNAVLPALAEGEPFTSAELRSTGQKKGLAKAYAELKGISEKEAREKIKDAKSKAALK